MNLNTSTTTTPFAPVVVLPQADQQPSQTEKPLNTDSFKVGIGTHLMSGLIARFPKFWSKLASLETSVLEDKLASIEIERPVFVTGLARSGTTILLEILASHPDVTTHQYRDFPALFTPYWWGQANKNKKSEASERTHGDGLVVTTQSPEAMDEMLWSTFFKDAHDPNVSQVMTASDQNPTFENLIKAHIQKLLLLRGGQRYAAKGNYHVTRLGYLKRLFPDASFIVPVRNPVNHIASLVKQHRLFCQGEKEYPRALKHMQRVGHYEFGLDVRLINTGNTQMIQSIYQLWKDGEDVRGWARYWASLYGWFYQFLNENPHVEESTSMIQYEQLCAYPSRTLRSVLGKCDLLDDSLVESWSGKIAAPSYYKVSFADSEMSIIDEETRRVAKQFGY